MTYSFDLVSVTMVIARLLATETVSSTALLPLKLLPPPRSLSLAHLATRYTHFRGSYQTTAGYTLEAEPRNKAYVKVSAKLKKQVLLCKW